MINGISTGNINEDNGTVTFTMSEFDIGNSTSNVVILNEQTRNSQFILFIDREFN